MEAIPQNALILKTSIAVSALTKGWTADTIRIARKARNLTQAELAEALGCRQQTISEWEQAMYSPKNAYQKLLDQFFSAKEGGATQEESAAPRPVNALTPAADGSFTVTRDQLLGVAKFMEMENLGEMRIAFTQAQTTFRLYDSETPAAEREGAGETNH